MHCGVAADCNRPCRPPASQPDAASQRGPLQLVDALDARDSGSAGGPPPPAGAEPLPHGFLEALAAQQEPDTLGQMLAPVGACAA